ncbi:MAG TPA: glycosyltransferase family 1 protein [Moraxellaceae bacterium]|nr:glycosyltransferase family 1 protein [Moraxellaceae bacterium]
MKIVYVLTQSNDIGGASVHLLDLASAVQAQGHEVVILAGGDGVFHARARDVGLKTVALRHLVREISPWHDVQCVLELHREFRQHKPDLVHLHSTKAGVVGRLAAGLLGLPVIFTAHGWAFTDGVSARQAALYCHIEKFMARFASRIIAVSDYDRQLALKAGVGNPALITTIHNGMPSVAITANPSVNKNAVPRIIMVARFDSPKNQKDLLLALQTIKDQPWQLELVGDGALWAQTKALADYLGLADRVEFPGTCTDVAERLARSDIFALVSNWEGLPLSVLEAMRAGLPVVASDVGGVSEVVIAGETGLLAARADTATLAAHLRLLLASPETRQKMGQAGRAHFESGFTFQQMLDNTMAVYRDVLAEKQ